MGFIKQYTGLLIILLLSIPAILPFFQPGFFSMHDDTQVTRVYEMGKSLKDGMFPVRWVEDLGYGYGYPIFNFYSPLPYYLGGFLWLVGFDALFATKAVFVIGIILSGIFMYFFVRSFSNISGALVSAILYLYFPYHALNIYVRGALGEVYAYTFLPLIFWGIYGIYKRYDGFSKKFSISEFKKEIRVSYKWVLITSFGIFGILTSHNLYSYMLVWFLVLLAVILIIKKTVRQVLGLILLSCMLGFGLAAFYILPAIFEMGYTNVASQIGGGAYYPDHFICPAQLWQSDWGFGGSVKGCIDGLSFSLGKINILLIFFSSSLLSYAIIKKRKDEQTFLYLVLLIFFLTSIFLSLPYSELIWRLIPGSDYIQYPWRFLGYVGFFMTVFISYLYTLLKGKVAVVFTVIILCLIFLTLTKVFVPQKYYDRDSNFYTNKNYIMYEVSKISDEYMPVGFFKPKSTLRQAQGKKSKLEIIGGEGDIKDLNTNSKHVKAIVNANTEVVMRANIAYFPSWRLYVDGNKTTFNQMNDGLYFDVPRGRYAIELIFEQTPIQIIGNLASALSVFFIFLVIIYRYAKKTS